MPYINTRGMNYPYGAAVAASTSGVPGPAGPPGPQGPPGPTDGIDLIYTALVFDDENVDNGPLLTEILVNASAAGTRVFCSQPRTLLDRADDD